MRPTAVAKAGSTCNNNSITLPLVIFSNPPHFNRQAYLGGHFERCQGAEAGAATGLIGDAVHAVAHVLGGSGGLSCLAMLPQRGAWAACGAAPGLPRDQFGARPINYVPALAIKQDMDHSIAVAYLIVSDLPDLAAQSSTRIPAAAMAVH